MALNSPGVEVQVIDESFYVPAEPSTRPLIIFASKKDKTNASGTGIATGTLAANVGKLYLITSQRELTETFGTPLFYKDPSNNPIHGGELNEYGLQAAYSFLGVANSCYVIRADIDLTELEAQYTEPGANPAEGTYWLDTQNTRAGIFEWNGSAATVSGGQKFTNKVPKIITDSSKLDEAGYPSASIGIAGDYALVSVSNLNKAYYKNRSGIWVLIGSPEWHVSWPTVKGESTNPSLTNLSTMYINGVLITSGTTLASLVSAIGNNSTVRGVSAAIVDGKLEIYSNGAVDSEQMDSTASNTIVIKDGTGGLLANLGITAGSYNGPRLQISPHTQVPRYKANDYTSVVIAGTPTDVSTARPTGSLWIKTTDVNLGARWRVKLWNKNTEDWDTIAAPLYSTNETALYGLDRAGGGANIPSGAVYVQYNFEEESGSDESPRVANFKIWRRIRPDPTVIISEIITNSTFDNGNTYTFNIAETQATKAALQSFKTISFEATGVAVTDAESLAEAINAGDGTNQDPFKNVEASIDSSNRLVLTHRIGGDMRVREVPGNGVFERIFLGSWNNDTLSGTANLYQDPLDPIVGTAIPGDPDNGTYATYWYIVSNWKPLSYTASEDPPQSLPADGRLWYNSAVDEVDIMVHNGTKWVGYLDTTSPYYPVNVGGDISGYKTDPNGPIIGATRPTTQSDGTPLRNGDLWIDTGDLENYPALYKFDGFSLTWVAVDTTDQTTEDGIIFADARAGLDGGKDIAATDLTAAIFTAPSGTIQELLTSDFVDFDAPDPDLYPRGMLLFNTRRSGFNVKRFVRNHIDQNADNVRWPDVGGGESMEEYYPHRWVNESGNAPNGSGLFGRKAQRKVVVKRLKAMTDTNQAIRDWERHTFNLISTPGYVENIANMVNLNYDRKLTGFVVGDTPFRLTSDATTLTDWGSNVALTTDNNDEGLVTYDQYLGVYYPSAFTSDNLGNDIVVPASHMVLRTIALSDAVSFPWFAPAGIRRGGITNASSIGYVDAQEGEFRSIAINEGQRDALYSVGINPITFLTGSGLVIFGQKTRARAASALDRINVARLVIYLRGQLDKLCKPYIFEPNDKITRDEIKSAADSLMLDLVSKRAVYDFLTVCDESNNTPSRIDRNELWLDIAIEPVKAIEFIYIPLRLKNTGEIAGISNPGTTQTFAG